VNLSAKSWRVGSLVYDRRALFNVFFWMLWGDFCLNLMDSGVGQNIATVQLDKYGATKTTIGLVTGTAVELMSVIMVAITSTWSDRHRGWLGRRMPFMLWSTPPLAAFLILTGFSPQISTWLRHHLPGLLSGLSLGAVIIFVFSTFYLGYKFCDLFPQSVYYYLWTDVIPQELMGTFASLFRAVATAGSLVFNLFLIRHLDDRPAMICLIAAGLYLVSFLMLCFMVKEGEYPPPEPAPAGSASLRLRATVARYMRDCFSLPFYWKFYLFYICFMCGFRPFQSFLLLYGKQTLKMDLATYGRVMMLRDLVQIVVFFAIARLIDRFHPIRAGLAGYVMILLAAVASWFYIGGTRSFGVCIVLLYVAVAVYQGAIGALSPRMLPRESYGQFCSANSIVWHLGVMIATPTLGFLADKFGNPVLFVWFFSFSAAGIVMMWLVYRDWKKLGGDDAYVPPIAGAIDSLISRPP